MPALLAPEKVTEQIAHISREQALQSNLIDARTLKKYDDIQVLNREYFTTKLETELALQRQDTPEAERLKHAAQAKFEEALAESATLNPQEKKQISNYIALQTNAMIAAANYERSRAFLSPKERFKTYLRDGLINDGDPKQFLTRTHGTLDRMVISTTFTIHPTLWDTDFARELQKNLSADLEDSTGKMHRAQEKLEHAGEQAPSPAVERQKREASALPPATLEKVRKRLSGAAGQLASGRANLTPMKKVTIPMENTGERNFSDVALVDLNSNISAWNEAVKEIANDRRQIAAERARQQNGKQGVAFESGPAAESNIMSLLIDDRRRSEIIEFRTWGRESDADGRDASTSPGFHQWINDDIKQGGRFVSRDMRDNSSQLIDVVSALIQTNYHRSKKRDYGNTQDFYHYCLEFAKKAEKDKEVKESWTKPDKSIFQEMKEDAQSQFLQGLITEFSTQKNKENFKLIPDEIYHRTLQFCDHFYEALNEFNRQHKLPEGTTFEQLARIKPAGDDVKKYSNLQTKFRDYVQEKQFSSLGDYKYCYEIDKEGYYQANLHDKGYNFLEDRIRLDKKGGKEVQKLLTPKERRMLMDVVKRLVVADDAVTKYGSKVVDRYQIANFSDPSHFYALMLLMQQTGILGVENGEVKYSKIAIQPLIETAEDRDHAPDIFRKLLSQPLGRSYFEAISKQKSHDHPWGKGYVEVMMGFSDGAATGGNFASEWGMYKCMKDIADVFAEKHIQVRFFKGRGRGGDRGGQHEAGLDMATSPDRTVDLAISDVTRQSDLPQHGYISKTYDQDMYASAMLGVLSARDRLLTRTQDEQRRQESYERACQFIAKQTEQRYFDVVRKRTDGQQLAFFDAMPQNPDITTRAAKRAMAEGVTIDALSPEEKIAVFDKTRAITKEYRQRIAGLPSYETGLKEALEEYKTKSESTGGVKPGDKEDIRVLSQDKDGRDVWLTGLAALQDMYAHFDFFRTMVDKGHLNVREGYDPIRAGTYGQKTGTEKFVGEVCASVDGLLPVLDDIRAPALHMVPRHKEGRLYTIDTHPTYTRRQYSVGARNLNPTQGAFRQLTQMSHLLMLSSDMKSWHPPEPEEPLSEDKKTMRNCLYVASVAGLQQGLHAQNDVTLQVGASQPRVMTR